ncbi:MAG: transcriptional regulator, partial [Mesorhizobium sp.]
MPTIFDELLAAFRTFWDGVDDALVRDAVGRIDREMPERPLTPHALSALRHLDRLAGTAMPAARPLVELLAGNRGGFCWGQTYTAE